MRSVLAASLLAVLALAPAARAQEPAPAPVPCDGDLLVKDAAGDQSIKAQGQPVRAAPTNSDTLGLFFRVDDGVTTANIVMSEVGKTVESPFQSIRHRVYVTVGGTVRYLEAMMTSSGVAYSYGTGTGLPAAAYEKDGDTKGAMFEGKPGVVQIVLPDAVAKAGVKLDAVSASIGMLTYGSAPPEAQTPPIYWGVDTAPDGTSTVSTTPPNCPPAAAAPADPGAQTPPPAEQPPTQQQQQQQQQPPPQQPAPQPGPPPLPPPYQASEFRLSLARATLSARRTKRLARFSLRSTERLTGVTVRFQRRSKVLSQVSFETLQTRRTLKFKLKRKLARGAHRLVVSGTRPDGTTFTEVLAVRVRR